MEEGIYIEKVKTELAWCFTYDQAEECRGASGRKLRQVCIYCPNYRPKLKKKGDDDNGHPGHRGSIGV